MAQDEADYLEVLLDEISKYENKHHALAFAELAPHELLQSFMKDHGLKQIDMQVILSVSSGVMSELVSGKRAPTKEHCVKLGSYFKVSPRTLSPKGLRLKHGMPSRGYFSPRCGVFESSE